MRPTEMVRLCDWVAAIKPAQRMNDETPDAWFAVMGGLDFEQAKRAVIVIAAREPWIEPHEIVAEVKRQRSKALEGVDQTTLVPDADPDNPQAYARALREQRYRAASGKAIDPAGRDRVKALVSGLSQVLPAVPRGETPRPALRPARELPGA